MLKFVLVALALLQLYQICLSYDLLDSGVVAMIASRPSMEAGRSNSTSLQKRQNTGTEMSTCGYFTGDPDKPRTADRGFNCRFDTRNGLWGFCPTTVISATDCGLAGSCVDNEDCNDGCGKTDHRSLTTFTCTGRQVCSTALLEFGVDQTYSYIACGASARTDIYLANAATTRDSPTSVESDESTTSSSATTATSGPASTSKAETSTSDNELQRSRPSPTDAQATTPRTGQEAEETTATKSPSSSSNNSAVPIGPVVGGVIGGLVIVCATIIAVVYIRRSNRRKAQASPDLPASNETQVYQHQYEPKTDRGNVPGLGDSHELTGNHRWDERRVAAELGT